VFACVCWKGGKGGAGEGCAVGLSGNEEIRVFLQTDCANIYQCSEG